MENLVVCTGQSVLDIPVRGLGELSRERESTHVERIGMNLGGDAVNESVVLTKLGVPTKLYSALSDDAAGKALAMLLDEAGVDRSLCEWRPGTVTQISIPIVFEDAERVFISARKVNPALEFVPNPEKIAGARVVTFGSLYSRPYQEVENALGIARAARAQGSIVCADLAHAKGETPLEDFAELWPYVDFFFPNDSEAKILTGKDDPDEMADVLLSYGMGAAIIKIGRRGCLYASKDERFIVPPHMVESPVDTTGAGDNFCAGFICGLLEGKDIRECCRYANAAASICIQYDGASTGIKSREQLQEVLDNY